MDTAPFSQPPPEPRADPYPQLPVDPDVDAARPLDRGPVHLRGRYVAVVFAGGVLGTLCRYGAGQLLPAVAGLPVATLGVNLLGCLLLGWLLQSLARRGPDRGRLRLARLLLGTGFLGAFTTYSAMAVEVVQLGWAGRTVVGIGYLVASLGLGAVATVLGIWLAGRGHR